MVSQRISILSSGLLGPDHSSPIQPILGTPLESEWILLERCVKAPIEMRAWNIQDAADLYSVNGWGNGYFDINAEGHVVVLPEGKNGPQIDLQNVVQDLVRRGLSMPLLLRFSDILRRRVETINNAFQKKIEEYNYKGSYRAVMPIKVNQQRHVVEELTHYGKPYGLGLEAGSKPELLVALALLDQTDGLIICNGYKDEDYIETALYAQRLGRNVLLIVDRFQELDMIIDASKRLGLPPSLGVRAKLSTRGSGKWAESGGDRSKFGLTALELVRVVERLNEVNMLNHLNCLHFHIGSQITNIRAVKEALNEGVRIFIDLYKMGADLRFFDIGGGLAVDYDGSQTNFHASMNYTLDEYASDVVYTIGSALEKENVEHPTIISESGRSLVAHHAVLIFNVVGESGPTMGSETIPAPTEKEHQVLTDLREVAGNVSPKNYNEFYHDAVQLKEDALSLYRHGILDLKARATAESLFWTVAKKIWKICEDLGHVPEDLESLQKQLSDTYFCNFSVFQSVPDAWAVKQLFPVMPIHRLKEKPTRRAVLADLTCDSDGKMDRFIDLHDVRFDLEVHPLIPGQPYILGVFLVGAYQETLGDLHNLFGDTHAVHLKYDQDTGYVIQHVEEGDTVKDVLSYVEYDQRSLMEKLRRSVENALTQGRLTFEESATLVRRYEQELAGYTYLEDASISDAMLSEIAKKSSEVPRRLSAAQAMTADLPSREAPMLAAKHDRGGNNH